MERRPRLRGGAEFDLIAAVARRLPRPSEARGGAAKVAVGIGDDAAITIPSGATATSADALVEGVHFRREDAPMRSIGHKALATALSDLAAMGAAAGEAYVTLGLPEDVDEDDCLQIADGLAAVAARTGCAVVGGDVTRSPVLLLAVTAVGHLESADAAVCRDGAAPGDVLAVTGELGGAAAGLTLLDRPELADQLDEGARAALRGRQLEPQPRLEAGAALAAAGVSAMIDISDGLGADAEHLAAASGVGIEIELDRVPVQPGVADVAAAARVDPAELATAGGEDYELLALLPEGAVEAAEASCGGHVPLTVIGRATRGAGTRIGRRDGSAVPTGGFDQLRAPRRGPGERG